MSVATPEPARRRAKLQSGSPQSPGKATMHMMRPVIFVALSCVLNSAHAALITEIESNDTFASAQDLSGHFSTDFVAEIFDSTTHPHVSIRGRATSENDVDLYRFFVPASGVTGFFDIDGACLKLSLDGQICGEGTDTILTLFDAGQRVLADSDDAGRTTDPGSATIFDAFLGTYRFNAAGWYFIAVSNYMNFTDFDLTGQVFPMVRPDGDYGGISYGGSGATFTWDQDGLYDGGNYTLHVSLSQVPEPTTLALFGLGLAGSGYQQRRKHSAQR